MGREISIMDPLRKKKKKSRSSSPSHYLDVWGMLAPIAPHIVRTGTALAELAVETCNNPELLARTEEIGEAIVNEFKAREAKVWADGIKHGKWLEQKARDDLEDDPAVLKAKLAELQLNFAVLEGKYFELKAHVLQSDTLEPGEILEECVMRDLPHM